MIDLSHELGTGMTVFPGDPSVTIEPALTIAEHGVAVSHLDMGSHTGTHLDAPSHTVVGGRTLDQVTLEELVGEALVLRIPGLSEREPIDVARLEAAGVPESVPKIVVIHTAWDQHFGTDTYLRHPFLTREAAQLLVDRGMHLLAVDTLNPDFTPLEGDDADAADFPVHEVVLGGDGLIVENVRGLEAVADRVQLGFFALRLGKVDGSPVRAVAW